MKTQEFINTLRSYPNHGLVFEYAEGKYVRNDFHITEIKNVNFDTVDCGGQRNQWSETHIQLWENGTLEPDHNLNAQKALKIFDLVHQVRPTLTDTDIKFEYGNKSFHTAILNISGILVEKDQLHIKLFESTTTCKAKDRASTEEEKAAACCGPEALPKPKVKLSLKSLKKQSENCCEPSSDCC
ncbi:hypothetical protein IFO69_18025 [Echinicola sp. CAU 1574]|uniref:Uncharacterized protein n=1 Tax=Echinicola arenosa TaxID=2774144 RepID=A0ABR9APF4_9BACT|nr:DUF6428 family protein [Echinicola arenosa]MBD8490657.1 hypothetical protein [Echinicola arenosa]